MSSNDQENESNGVQQSDESIPDQFDRTDYIEKTDQVLRLQRKLTDIDKQHQAQLIKYDEMLVNLKREITWLNSILVQERMNFFSYASSFYSDTAYFNKRIVELETDLSDSSSLNEKLTRMLENEEQKFKMTKEAYSGVFEAIIKNFQKIYGSIGLPTDIFETNNQKLEVTIEKIFEQFPKILNRINELKNVEKSFAELRSKNKFNLEEKELLIRKNSGLKEDIKILQEEIKNLKKKLASEEKVPSETDTTNVNTTNVVE